MKIYQLDQSYLQLEADYYNLIQHDEPLFKVVLDFERFLNSTGKTSLKVPRVVTKSGQDIWLHFEIRKDDSDYRGTEYYFYVGYEIK